MFGCAAHISNNLIILLPEGVKRKLIECIPGYRLQALNQVEIGRQPAQIFNLNERAQQPSIVTAGV